MSYRDEICLSVYRAGAEELERALVEEWDAGAEELEKALVEALDASVDEWDLSFLLHPCTS
jgi:hypothetical protein